MAAERLWIGAGVAVWLISIVPPLASLSASDLSVHAMSQLAIMMIASPLIIFGLRNQLVKQNLILQILTHPIVSWIVFVGTLIVIYLPNFVTWTSQNPVGARLIDAIFLPIISAVYFWPILQSELNGFPYALRIMSLFFMMVPETMIGFFIYIQNHIVYPAILYGEDFESLLSKQQQAGALMWSLTMVVDSIWIAFAVRKWFASEKEKGEQIKREILAEQN